MAEDALALARKCASECLLLEDRLATLEGQHKKLRGRFYSEKPAAESAVPSTREERRAAALKHFGILPKPNHDQEQ